MLKRIAVAMLLMTMNAGASVADEYDRWSQYGDDAARDLDQSMTQDRLDRQQNQIEEQRRELDDLKQRFDDR